MTVNYYFFDTAPVYQAEWSKSIGKVIKDGVFCGVYNDLFVYADASGMHVKVKSGAAHIKGHYYFSDAEQILPISAAPGTAGQSRYDLVVLEVNWSTKSMAVKVVTGTAAASPSQPSLTKTSTIWQIALARVTVAYGDTNVPANKVQDYRPWALGTFEVPIVIGSGQSAITTGPAPVAVPINAAKIVRWSLVADQTGSIVIDLWKDHQWNYPPTVADTIITTGKPGLSAQRANFGTVWNEATYPNFNGGNWPGHAISASIDGNAADYGQWWILPNVDSAATVMMVNLTLTCARLVSAQA